MRKTLHVQEIGMKVKAEKNEEGWHIEISPEFAKELESMEPEQREEVLDLVYNFYDWDFEKKPKNKKKK